MRREYWDAIIIGGGAAGFFGAVTLAEALPGSRICILEKGREVLQKVRISGGGRCNVTHACFDPRELIAHYPRGSRELLGPFHQFGPTDTVHWFERRGVPLKTEADGRMFPHTDDASSIVDCLVGAARKGGVVIRLGSGVRAIRHREATRHPWMMDTGAEEMCCRAVLVTTGSSPAAWRMLDQLGLQLRPSVPSLFTLHVREPLLQGLAGVSVPHVSLGVQGQRRLQTEGPMLITHWGLSGPAVLRLSAWGARALHQLDYKFTLVINWLNLSEDAFAMMCQKQKQKAARRRVANTPMGGLPQRLWGQLMVHTGIPQERIWAELRREEQQRLLRTCLRCTLSVNGKSTFKEEFVTAGGVDLKEVNFSTFQARRFPGLFLAGEVLDIDAITGGFNFQAAWTGAYLAGNSMAAQLR
jgi:predicted Rossmann fold flavoprotein